MSISSEMHIERLNEILRKKKILLQDILVLTKNQSQTITEDGIESLQKLISDKQLKIDEIDKLDDEFSVYFHRLKTVLNVSSLDELSVSGVAGAKQLRGLTKDILKLIADISEIEKQNNRNSKELLGQLGSEIKKINQGKKVNNAYIPNMPNTVSYFIDKKK